MSITLEPFAAWLNSKRREVRAASPVSIQTNIATLSHRLNLAEDALAEIRGIHRADPTVSYPCATIRALDDNNNKGVIMTDNDALNQTRDALHTAFTIIANARNCLDNGERDPVLAEQWHEAAARFMQDYNANLDVYTGYRVSGRNECPTCSGPVRETVGMVCQTCGTDYGKERLVDGGIDALRGWLT